MKPAPEVASKEAVIEVETSRRPTKARKKAKPKS